MASIARIRVAWTGFTGAPGVSTFFADPATANPPVAELRTFYDAIKALFPTTVTIQVPDSGDTIEETTGEIDGTWSVTPAPAAVVGTSVSAVAAPAGAVMNLLTGTIIDGRRLRGKSFLVPLAVNSYEANGSIVAAQLTVLRNAAVALAGATNPLMVWHRPTLLSPGPPPVYNADGQAADVDSITVPDLVAVLRSRRD